jgi:hypothetical protein
MGKGLVKERARNRFSKKLVQFCLLAPLNPAEIYRCVDSRLLIDTKKKDAERVL